MTKLFKAIVIVFLHFSFVFFVSFNFVYADSWSGTADGRAAATTVTQDGTPAAPSVTTDTSEAKLSNSICADFSGAAASVGCSVVSAISWGILSVIASITSIAAYVFDIAVKNFVLQISTLFIDSGGQNRQYIYLAWSLIRDVGNALAFFGATYTGFRYIIGKEDMNFQKSVVKLVLYSLLVNFSFPIAKFFIDISNVVSLQIYGSIINYKFSITGLKDAIMNAIGLNSFVSDVGKIKSNPAGFNSFTSLWLAIIFLILTFFVFLYSALQILIRSFILIACVIFSPVMFLNFAFPKITEFHEKWRDNFFGQLVFAPMLMIGFWLSFTLLNAATGGTGNQVNITAAAASTTSDGYMMGIVNLLLAIIALLMGVKLSTMASGGVGKFISNSVGGVMKNAGLAVATGGIGVGMRGFGALGSRMANAGWVKNTTKENHGAIRNMAASLASRAGNRLANTGVSIGGKKADSFATKSKNNFEEEKKKFSDKNFEALKQFGLSGIVAQASTPEELKNVEAELKKRSASPNDKKAWNQSDVLGRVKKAAEAQKRNQRLTDMRLGNVSDTKGYTAAVDELDKLKEEAADPKLAEEAKKAAEAAAKAEKEKSNLSKKISSESSRLAELRKGVKKTRKSAILGPDGKYTEEEYDDIDTAKVKETEERLKKLQEIDLKHDETIKKKTDLEEQIKVKANAVKVKEEQIQNEFIDTTISSGLGKAIGSELGNISSGAKVVTRKVADITGATALAKGVGSVYSAAVETVDAASRKGAAESLVRNAADSFRAKKKTYAEYRDNEEAIKADAKAKADAEKAEEASRAPAGSVSNTNTRV